MSAENKMNSEPTRKARKQTKKAFKEEFDINQSRFEEDEENKIGRVLTASTITDRPVNDSTRGPRFTHEIAQSIIALIRHPETQTPLTIGILGAWGTGKTSLMNMIINGLNKKTDKRANHKKGISVWFDAWRHNEDKDLRQSFLWAITNQLENNRNWLDILYRRFKYLWLKTNKLSAAFFICATMLLVILIAKDYANIKDHTDIHTFLLSSPLSLGFAVLIYLNPKAIPKMFTWFIKIVPATHVNYLIEGKTSKGELSNIDQVRSDIRKLIESYLADDQRLVIFIDDLDRCSPSTVVRILESINVLVDFDKCVFVLGMDYDKVIRIVGKAYAEAEGDGDTSQKLIGHHFLEKIVQLPIKLNQWDPQSIKDFSHFILNMNKKDNESGQGSVSEDIPIQEVDYPDTWKEYLVKAVSLLNNPSPRSLKRFFVQANFFYLLCERYGSEHEYSPYLFVYLMVVLNREIDNIKEFRKKYKTTADIKPELPALSGIISDELVLEDHLALLVASINIPDDKLEGEKEQ